MVPSVWGDEFELVDSVGYRQGFSSITFESIKTAQQVSVEPDSVKTSNAQLERERSGSPVNCSSSLIVGNGAHQPPVIASTGGPYVAIVSHAMTDVIKQLDRKSFLKDISIECSSENHWNDQLSLVIMHGARYDTLTLSKMSSTKWIASENFELGYTEDSITLVIRTNDGGDEAFINLTADEMRSNSCAKQAFTIQRRELALVVEEDSPVALSIWINFTVASSLLLPNAVNFDPKLIEASNSAWHDAEECQRQFNETKSVNDISQAISHCEKAISILPTGLDINPRMSDFLGSLYLKRFEYSGSQMDVNLAMRYYQKAVEETPDEHPDLPGLLNHLGNSYVRRFTRFGDFSDIECAIRHQKKAIDCTPLGHADLPSWFTNLGVSYVYRYQRTGFIDDLDFSVAHLQQAVDTAHSGHTHLPSLLSNLGVSCERHFRYTGNHLSIDNAITHHKRAVESTPYGHAKLASRFNNLGTSYLSRFEHSGDLKDIDCAISYHQKALDSTTSDPIDLPNRLNNLGVSYLRRFERTGVLQDIDCALSHHHKAVDLTPSGHIHLPNRFVSLGTTYLRRFEHAGDLEDINRSIYYKQKAVEAISSGHADAPFLLNSLGNSYLRRFERTADLKDIECAISHHQKAVDSTPADHAELPSRLNNLGGAYFRRFGRTGDPKDIDCAIHNLQKAVDDTISGHPDLPSRLNNLGISYTRRFAITKDALDAQNSIKAYRRGAESKGSPSIRLSCAKRAALNCLIHDRSQCLEDFALAIALLSEVAGLEQTINHRYANLQDHTDFVSFAVMGALILGTPNLALEWLAHSRCLVWNQLSQLRTPIDDLRIANATLANRFVEVASALEASGSRSIQHKSSSSLTLAQEIRLQTATQKHNIHAADYRSLLDEIRALPKFHDFLRPPSAGDILSSLPTNGHVVVFNLDKIRCDALALVDGMHEPMHIPLDNFSLEQALQLQKTLRVDLLKHREAPRDNDRIPQRIKSNPSSMSLVLKELWCKVVKPILDAIGYSSQLDSSARRRIWWCPTGPLVFLPLHAAGIYGSEYKFGSCISDYAVSSYTPTVQTLKEKFSASSIVPENTSIALVSPNTPDIPFTQMEIQDLKVLFDRFLIDSVVLEGAAATTDGVKRHLAQQSWAHFACHGIQDVLDPLKSGVDLHNGRLELLEIMRQKLPNPDFIFFSACQTSKGDLRFSEEVVHLAAGMLAAGYRGVVGTMWSISDRHGPIFAKHFYEYLLEERGSKGLDGTHAAYALDHATRRVRETLEDKDSDFLTWVPYVHFGY